jgi:aldehyde dehydrogenase (NAD+)
MVTKEIIDKQREYYLKGNTLSVDKRIAYLKKLRNVIKKYDAEINKALKEDLNKHVFESKMTETGIVLEEINYVLKNIRKWSRDIRVKTPIAQFYSKSFVHPEPYGVVLIMSPWNYPFQLAIEPLIGALAAGNCGVIKPSAYAKETSIMIKKIINDVFPKEYVEVVLGGREENKELLNEKFDYIFFTGSVNVGKYVMECASKNLTPISLELGGKSPVIIDDTANIKLAAKRIAWGKIINAGQTCVAPDYVLINQKVKEDFINEYIHIMGVFFDDKNYKSLPRIINDKHFDRVLSLIDFNKVVFGGDNDKETRFIEPTLMDKVTFDDDIMKEEIFGPILPLIEYKDIEEAINAINKRPCPLALYLFTQDDSVKKKIISRIKFGGGCINDTIIHVATSNMAFGGVGESGMGGYHGKASFDTFTHYKAIVDKATFIDLPLRYPPYTKLKKKVLDKVM